MPAPAYARTTTGPTRAERAAKAAAGLSWCRLCADWRPAADVRAGLCRPHTRAEERRRYAAHPEVRAERRQHAHARSRGVEPIPPEGQAAILEVFEGQCAYCGASAETWDHIVPISRGGRTTPGNVVPACRRCNSSKRDRDDLEWMIRTGRTEHPAFMDRLILAYAGNHG